MIEFLNKNKGNVMMKERLCEKIITTIRRF